MEKYEDLFNPSFLSDVNHNKVLSPLPKDATVTMAYIPYQQNIDPYKPEQALENGTLFEQLNKPFERGGKNR